MWDAAIWSKNLGSGVSFVTLSPDDRLVAAGAEDGSVSVYDMMTGMLVGEPDRNVKLSASNKFGLPASGTVLSAVLRCAWSECALDV